MCGIAGLISKKASAPDEGAVRRMTQIVSHRGPDGEGFFRSGRVAFGHRRLSIIDLSEAAAQPMTLAGGAPDDHLQRRDLQLPRAPRRARRARPRFRTRVRHRGDPRCLRAMGRALPPALQRHVGVRDLGCGTAEVFCARDRFGVKPFYYVDTPETSPSGPRSGSSAAARPRRRRSRPDQDLHRHRRDRPGRAHLVCRGSQAPRRTFRRYDLGIDRFRVEPFYRLRPRTELAGLVAEEAGAQFGGLLDSAIELRLRSDVTVGTCLSGGLDSSSVATLAAARFAAAGGGRFSAITAVSEDPGTDETPSPTWSSGMPT